MRPPKNDRQRQSRRRGFDDDNFFGNTPPLPPSFSGFGSSSSAPEAKATVKWYNSEKGFGFVEMADGSGDVFLHANSLQQAGFQTVTPGSILQIRVGQGQKGRQVDQVVSVHRGHRRIFRRLGPSRGCWRRWRLWRRWWRRFRPSARPAPAAFAALRPGRGNDRRGQMV